MYNEACFKSDSLIGFTYQKVVEGGSKWNEANKYSNEKNTGGKEEKFESLMPDVCLEDNSCQDGGQAASQSSQGPDKVDAGVGDTDHKSQVRLDGSQNPHGHALAHMSQPGHGEVGK